MKPGSPRKSSSKVYWSRKARAASKKSNKKQVIDKEINESSSIDWFSVKMAALFLYVIIFIIALLIKKLFF